MILIFLILFSALVLAEDNNTLMNIDFGVLPTNLDLHMFPNDYSFSIALLALTCAFVFWLGWNAHT